MRSPFPPMVGSIIEVGKFQIEDGVMGMNNRSDSSADRRNGRGKGDMPRVNTPIYRAGAFWGVSDCCRAMIETLGGQDYCEKCGKQCKKVDA